MASGRTNTALAPSPSLFGLFELVELVAQYLSRQDILHCLATSKSWAHQFRPFLWRDVVLKSSHPAPQFLALNRHRIQSLYVSSNDYANLHTLATDLPNITPSSGLSPLCCSTNSSIAGAGIFQNLRIIRVDYESEEIAYDWKERSVCLDYVLRILNQSPNLLQLAPPENILYELIPSTHIQSFLYVLAHKLPCVKELEVRGSEEVSPETVFDFLRVCLNHPQLVDLHCNFSIQEENENTLSGIQQPHLFNNFFEAIEDDARAREAAGSSVLRSPIKSLVLPKTNEGYACEFVCMLLILYLPNLERFHIPNIGEGGFMVMEDFEVAVAHGCPKLQHLWCSYNENDYSNRAINGIIQGCKQWGLKSFYCENMNEHMDYSDYNYSPDDHFIMEALVNNHSGTLEEVELANCRMIRGCDLVELFSCRNLKKAKIHQSSTGSAAMQFQDVRFGCHDLKELQMTLAQPETTLNPGDYGPEKDEVYKFVAAHERVEAWMRGRASEAYTQIGSLSKLETLSLRFKEWDGVTLMLMNSGYDLTLKRGWLRQLVGLKELKHFHMAADFWSEMGRAEVEFMDAQWPKLEKIEFSCSDLKAIVEKPHWQWLQKRRPSLRYLQF
ncbi:MAG: hypothetical protein J3Q66DRAFT_424637 [Benniella sp.]|nr:MAG: hypothetical protein J3Q66DRAFT_424637 [Benniella sp.]